MGLVKLWESAKAKIKSGFDTIMSIGSDMLSSGARLLEKGAVIAGWQETADYFHERAEAFNENRKKWEERANHQERIIEVIDSDESYNSEPPQEILEEKVVTYLQSEFEHPEAIGDELVQLQPEQRIEKIEKIANEIAPIYGLKIEPLKYYEAEDSSMGAYNREENSIYVNTEFLTCDEPELVEEQIYTILHEAMHARQWKALQEYKEKGISTYGYSLDTLLEWAECFKDYIRPEECFEAYTKQAIERDAFGLEERIKKRLKKNVKKRLINILSSNQSNNF